MRRKTGRRRQGARRTLQQLFGHYPVSHRQQVFFAVPLDLVAGARAGFTDPKDPELFRYLDHHLDHYARGHGWGVSTTGRTRQGLRILCALQDTPGAPVKATDVMRLPSIELPADPVLVVLEAAGVLEEDRPSTFGLWLDRKTAGLPPAIIHELRVCAEILLHGNPTPPRMRPRPRKHVQATIRHLLPAVHAWKRARPPFAARDQPPRRPRRPAPLGAAPAKMLTALRHLFRALKARKVVFVNPTSRIFSAAPSPGIPLPADLDTVRATLRSDDPTVAAPPGSWPSTPSRPPSCAPSS